MDRCPRCSKVVAANWAYCPVCGRPRILESLQEPVVQPAWKQRAWKGVVLVMSLWLMVTVGVAFLREAKAVRDSRTLLDEGKAQEAWQILRPFLPHHPEHRQALFLCGKETIRLNLKDEPKSCLQQLDKLSPELAKELRADYGLILTEQSRGLSCNAEAFQNQLAWGDELGGSFAENVIAGLDGMVESCHAAQVDHELTRIAAVLKDKGKAMSMVERGYVPAIGRAVSQARYQDAEALARQAAHLGPEGAAAVDAVLKDERRKVAATVETLRRLRDSLQADPKNRYGDYWCFPADSPAAVQAAHDGWERAVLYRPLGDPYSIEEGTECYAGFAVISYGSDGVETEGDWSCSSWYGQESCELPDRFWLTEE